MNFKKKRKKEIKVKFIKTTLTALALSALHNNPERRPSSLPSKQNKLFVSPK